MDAASVLAGNVDYVNGGITSDEADELRAQARSFPLEVQLAEHRGDEGNAFVADAPLRITDESGREVVDVATAGPIFLARVPDGRYTVEAEHNGKVKRQRVTVTGGPHAKVGFLW
ncbi:MAG TPA: carboxypeptidase regulatory-like domain-containing protein [Casimicrobiaceae bacterium]|nr:carboxypeptidase regulatory-like domain-containing protein [Casimicrobiaceae bacterium]